MFSTLTERVQTWGAGLAVGIQKGPAPAWAGPI